MNRDCSSAPPTCYRPILEDGEAWCAECKAVVRIIGPWQDMCPRGHWLDRSFYDGEDVDSTEAP